MKRLAISTYRWNLAGSGLYVKSEEFHACIYEISMHYNPLAKTLGWKNLEPSQTRADAIVTVSFEKPTDDQGESHGFYAGQIQRHLKTILSPLPSNYRFSKLADVGYLEIHLEKPDNFKVSELLSCAYFRIIDSITARHITELTRQELLAISPTTSQESFILRDGKWIDFGTDEHAINLKWYLAGRKLMSVLCPDPLYPLR